MTDHVPGPAPVRRSPLRRAVQALVGAVFLGFIVLAVAKRWGEVSSVLSELSLLAIGAATLAMLAGIWCSFLCWRAILTDLIHSGSPVPLSGAMRIFFVGQAGKYLPGKLWPILTQTRLGREYQVPPRASSAAAAIFMLMVLGTGLLVGAAGLPLLGPAAMDHYWWTLLVLPVAAALLWPSVLNRLLDLALRLAKREPMPRPLTKAGVAKACGWSLLMWALYGMHLWALLADLGADAPNLALRSTAAFAASWSIGFLLLIAPAGAGPREVALILLLRGTVAQAPATVAALVSRLIMTLGDLAWSGIALVVERVRRGRQAPPAVAREQPDDAPAPAAPPGR